MNLRVSGNVLASVFPYCNGATDVHVQRAHNTKLGNFDASIDTPEKVHRNPVVLSAQEENPALRAPDYERATRDYAFRVRGYAEDYNHAGVSGTSDPARTGEPVH